MQKFIIMYSLLYVFVSQWSNEGGAQNGRPKRTSPNCWSRTLASFETATEKTHVFIPPGITQKIVVKVKSRGKCKYNIFTSRGTITFLPSLPIGYVNYW